jgi:FixJ family two-component response regulator
MSVAQSSVATIRGDREPCVSVVEDDKAVRDALENLLESVGLKVRSFSSAEEFASLGPTGQKSCLILDVNLPQMSGLELQRHLTRTKNPIPIIFITAFTDEIIREQALREGALKVLYKPFNAEDLLDAVHSALK